MSFPRVTDEDLLNPENWVSRLSEDELLSWLRLALFAGDIEPLTQGHDGLIAFQLAAIAERNPRVKARLLGVVPLLVREWSSKDTVSALDNLIALTGLLRCAQAVDPLCDTTTRRASRIEDPSGLRARALNTIAGFSLTRRSRKFVEDCLEHEVLAERAFKTLLANDIETLRAAGRTIANRFGIGSVLAKVARATLGELKEPEWAGAIARLLSGVHSDRIPEAVEVLKREAQIAVWLLAGSQPEVQDPVALYRIEEIEVVDLSSGRSGRGVAVGLKDDQILALYKTRPEPETEWTSVN